MDNPEKGWFERLTGIKLFMILPHRKYWVLYYIYSFRQPITPEMKNSSKFAASGMDPLDVYRIHTKVSKTFWGLFKRTSRNTFVFDDPNTNMRFDFFKFMINETVRFDEVMDAFGGPFVVNRDICTNLEAFFYKEYFNRITVKFRNNSDAVAFKLMQ